MTKSPLHPRVTHMRPLTRSLASVLLLTATATAACDRPLEDSEIAPAADSAADSLLAGERDVPLAFDPDSLGDGDTLGTMVVSRRELRVDHEGRWVGTVHFAGEATLSGRYHPHFDYPEVRSTCFEVDDSSAVRLPRFAFDERRVWFCFENQEDVARSLGPPGSSGDATIVIDRYSTIRSFTDAVDGARLVRVLSREPEGSGGPPPPDGGGG